MNTIYNFRWTVIPSLPEYEASSLGMVRRVPYEAPMPKGGVRTYGGMAWAGVWDGKRYVLQFRGKTRKIARLVCEAFNGPPPFKDAVCREDSPRRKGMRG